MTHRPFREMADHVRRHPGGLSQDGQRALIETLEAPWDARTARAFKEVFAGGEGDPAAVTERIQAAVRERGMMPFEAPPPLPVIEDDEVELVCWMVVTA